MPVGPIDYQIRLVGGRSRRLEGAHGRTDHERSEIYISKRLSPDARVETLTHECLHALFFVCGVSHVLVESSVDEERIVRMVSPIATGLLLALGPDTIDRLRNGCAAC